MGNTLKVHGILLPVYNILVANTLILYLALVGRVDGVEKELTNLISLPVTHWGDILFLVSETPYSV